MDKKNTAGRGDNRGRIGEGSENGGAGSFRAASSGASRSREQYYERYSEPGRIDRPFTRRMEQEAARAAEQPAPEPEKEKKKTREKKKRVRDPEKKIFTWKRLLISVLILLAVGLALIILFGEHGTHHQMPVITPPESTEETVGG